MKITSALITVGYSQKRSTLWRDMLVGFNQKRTQFFKVVKVGECDANGGRVAKAQLLVLSNVEREDLLATWRDGKEAWYHKAAAAVRPKAQRNMDRAVAKLN